MTTNFLLVTLTIFALTHAQFSTCPASDALQIAQNSLTISPGGNFPLQYGVDIRCYNYTLTTVFNCTPSVAIAVNEFQSEYSPNLFFSIKVVPSDSFSVLPFIVRTHWGYTRWSKITFSFLAEASSVMEAGYYQIDTATLSACYSGKDISAFIPFFSANRAVNAALTFLNGYQISSIAVNSSYLTPYEVQVTLSSVTSQGLSIIVSSTSATQIHSLFVSYIAYSSSILNLVAGNYVYNKYTPTMSLIFSTSTDISNNNIAFHGFNSFIVRNTRSSFVLNGLVSGTQISFASNSQLFYLSYSYFFLVGGPCGQCRGFTINYQGKCLATCPPSSYFNGVTCITCDEGFIWNGNSCVSRCISGLIWDSKLQSCACPAGQNWNGTACIICPSTQVWSSTSNRCACPAGGNWNGFVCISCISGQVWNATTLSCMCPGSTSWNGLACISCPSTQIFSTQSNSCVCPQNSNWNGQNCITCSNGFVWNGQINACGCNPGFVVFRGSCALVPTCSNGQTLDISSNTCVCQSNYNWNGAACILCSNGQVWNSTILQCTCPQRTNWNGYSCVSCPTAQIWSSSSNACTCPVNQNWNGFSCIQCDGGRSWASTLNACSCPSGLNWNGALCLSCNPGSNWNGFSCITCLNGQIWNSVQNVCQCPSGQQWNGASCITPCPNGMITMNGLCSCPSGTYLLNGSCARQPTCPAGQTWSGLQCTNIQCPPGTSWNGTMCFNTPAQTCPAGTYYDGTKCVTNTTSCPAGTTWNGSTCQTSGNCPNGTYLNGSNCVPISQLCPPGLIWQNNQCVPTGNTCPTGTYLSGNSCIPFQPCTNGRIWNTTVSQCVCPVGSFWNGNICVQCSNGQTYQVNSGCACPQGTFLNNGACSPIEVNQCASVPNSIWNGRACVCNPGYSVIGMQCVCEGLAVNSSYCDRCFNKPNSVWSNGICQCNSGFVDVLGTCRKPTPNNTVINNTTPSCNVATYFDTQQLRCLPCSSGCLSCSSCYSCTSCQPGFYLDFISSLCPQTCGDGRRFTLNCDDGNNFNGDGCSSDCKVQVGWTCQGGSPNSRDTCTRTLPRALVFTSTGQSHLWGKIIINIRVNYLPLSLINSVTDCANQCKDVLSVRIVSGDSSTTGIVANYIPSTSFSFSIEINYQKEPIGAFGVQIGINPILVQRYFSGIDISNRLTVNVNPAFLALYRVDNNQVLQ